MHDGAPDADQRPGLHESHSTAPASSANRPAGQSPQISVPDIGANFPTVQSTQVSPDCAPTTAEPFPGSQAMQPLDPLIKQMRTLSTLNDQQDASKQQRRLVAGRTAGFARCQRCSQCTAQNRVSLEATICRSESVWQTRIACYDGSSQCWDRLLRKPTRIYHLRKACRSLHPRQTNVLAHIECSPEHRSWEHMFRQHRPYSLSCPAHL